MRLLQLPSLLHLSNMHPLQACKALFSFHPEMDFYSLQGGFHIRL